MKSPITDTQLRIRRPHGEMHAAPAISLREVSSELFVGAGMRAFCEQVQIEFTQSRLQERYSPYPDSGISFSSIVVLPQINL